MKITNIQVRLRHEEKLKGFVNITIDDCFVIRGCKIIKGSQGFFLSMPSQKLEDGSHRDICHPINGNTRREIEDLVLKAYVQELRDQDMIQPVQQRPVDADDPRAAAHG